MLSIKNYYEMAEKKSWECPPDLGEIWPRGIPVNDETYEMNLNAFKLVVETAVSKRHPIIVIFTCGTTVGHGIDDVE